MTNLNTLFDFTKFEKRKPADQRKFELNNEILIEDFVTAVHSSFRKLHTIVLTAIEPIDQERNLCAVIMSGYLVGFFKRKYPELCIKATKQRFKLWVDATNVYIKKLDEKTKLPSNIKTDESIKIYYQLTDAVHDKVCNIFLGYTVNEEWSMITGVYAVCFEGDSLLWISDLSRFQQESQSLIIPMTPLPTTAKVKPGAKKVITGNQ